MTCLTDFHWILLSFQKMLRRTISSACRRTLVPSRDIVAAPISRIASSVSLPPFDAVRPASTSSTLVNAMIWSKSEKKRCPEQVQRDMASVPGKKGVPPLDKRGDYSELTELDIAYFTSVLGEEGVIVDADDIEVRLFIYKISRVIGINISEL